MRVAPLSVRRFLREGSFRLHWKIAKGDAGGCVRFGPRCFASKDERSRGERAPSIRREREREATENGDD